MMLPIPEGKFTRFLCDAKIATYAAGDGQAKVTPLIKGSHQLEFIQGAFLYRDIYFGGHFFVGQETVFYQKKPTWAMSYAGGSNQGVKHEETQGIYQFLAAALREVPTSAPYRGPEKFELGEYIYKNRILGSIDRFSGVETILTLGIPVYQLHYSGGILKD